MDFIEGLNRINRIIDLYKDKRVSFYDMVGDLFEFYELIYGSINEKFSNKFHKYWDCLEEINAEDEENDYQEKINNELLPGLENLLKGYCEMSKNG